MKKLLGILTFLLLIGSVSASGVYLKDFPDGSWELRPLPLSWEEQMASVPLFEVTPYWSDSWVFMPMPVTVIDGGYLSIYPLQGFEMAQQIKALNKKTASFYWMGKKVTTVPTSGGGARITHVEIE